MAIPASPLVGGVFPRFHGFTPVSSLAPAGRDAITLTFSKKMKTFRTIFLPVGLLFGCLFGTAQAQDAPSRASAPTTTQPENADYVIDLEAALKLAKKTNKKIILYTGHNFHLTRRGIASPRVYFDSALVKASTSLAARRSEFIVCERFEFTAMYDAKGNISPDYFKFIKGWFGELNDRYDIRFLTPTITILDSNGKKLAGPIENFEGFDELMDTELKKIPATSP